MNEQQILQQLNRPGWKKTGERPEVEKVQGRDEHDNPTIVDRPTGNVVWTITGPNGQSDEITVKPPTPGVGGDTAVGGTIPWQNDPATGQPVQPQTGYTIVSGPKNNVQQPQAAAGWTDVKGITNSGVTTYYGRDPADGKFKQVPGLPSENQAKSTPTPADKLEIIKDPTTGKPIKLRDPATNSIIDLPNAATPARPTLVDGPNGSKYSWDGEKLTQQLAGTSPDAKPVEGQTRQSVIPGSQYIGQEKFHNGVWSIDDSFTPKPYVPSDKPKDGDVRPNTDSKGQAIQEVFRGGSWVTDTSVQPKPFGNQPPTTIATGTSPFIVQQTPDQAQRGETTQIPNPNTTDVAARVGQLQTAARSKRDQLQQAVSTGTKTAEEAASEFDNWWSSNVDPFSQQLQRTQQQADYDAQIKQRDQARLEQETQRAAYGTAETAGQNAVKNITDTLPYRVGPGYGAALDNVLGAFSSGKAPGPIDASGLTYQMPDLNDVARNATADALAHISPMAASIAGRPMPAIPQGLDVAGALNKSSYQFSGPTTQIAPDGTVTITHAPQQGYQGAPNPNVFGSGTGPYVPPVAHSPSPAIAPNEMNIFGNYAYGGG